MGAVIEEGAELEQLVAAADRGEALAPAAPDAPPSVQVADPGAEWVAAALQFGAMARTLLPARIAASWTDEALGNFGRALARCAEHYGWQFGNVINHPVAGLIAAGFPLAWPALEPYVMPKPAAAANDRSAPDAPPPPRTDGPPVARVKPIG
jgi:hypothetical protein